MFEFFGGVPELVVADNEKAAVDIAELSFDAEIHLLDQAKIGVLAGSLVAGALGAVFLLGVSRVTPTSAEHGSMESVANK